MRQMPSRQAAFRIDYRTRISPAYLGWVHVALIYALGGAAIWVLRAADYAGRPGTSGW